MLNLWAFGRRAPPSTQRQRARPHRQAILEVPLFGLGGGSEGPHGRFATALRAKRTGRHFGSKGSTAATVEAASDIFIARLSARLRGEEGLPAYGTVDVWLLY